MAASLHNVGWFYRGKLEQATGAPEAPEHKIIYFLWVSLTVIGFLTIASCVIQFIRLVFSLFILPGKPVCHIPLERSTISDVSISFGHLANLRKHGCL